MGQGSYLDGTFELSLDKLSLCLMKMRSASLLKYLNKEVKTIRIFDSAEAEKGNLGDFGKCC